MRTFKIAAAGLLLGVSGIALAQDASEGGEQDEFGAWVSNEAQTNAQNGGIGATVSAEAKLQGEFRGGDSHDDADDADDVEDIDDVDSGENEGIGAGVSAAAREASEDPDREGGVASSVLPETPANPRAREAVTAAGQAAARPGSSRSRAPERPDGA